MALQDDRPHPRVPGLACRPQAIEAASHPKVRRRRHIRPEVNMHVDRPMHDIVNR
ncbi:MAG: hypothetical protein HYU46_07360 [Deltaproteobacteria bacterium]|nr:hypothetical protein [Deltaproteobacteria bacterium]